MFRTLLFTTMLAIPFTAALAQSQCTPIRFAHGAREVVVHGVAHNMDTDAASTCFSLTTQRGQTATLALVGGDRDTGFTIAGVADDRDHISFKTEAKTYTIGVFQLFRRSGPTSFGLRVAVQ